MKIIFIIIIIFTIIQRLYELRLSKRNEKSILVNGGFIVPEKNYIFMVLLHTSWLAVILWMSLMTELILQFGVFSLGVFLFVLGQCLRIFAIKTLGHRWTTRIAIVPNSPAISNGLFKYIRHPNYLGVVLEIFALPLIGGLYSIAITFSLLNFIILFFRIRLEEKNLKQFNMYGEIFHKGATPNG